MRCTRNFRAVDLAVGLLMVAEMVLLMVATATWPEQRVPAAPSRMDLHLVDGSRTGAVCMGRPNSVASIRALYLFRLRCTNFDSCAAAESHLSPQTARGLVSTCGRATPLTTG
eukprot:SAG31_NODE_324_length_17691_cov_8.128126_14_plen_113_part_00